MQGKALMEEARDREKKDCMWFLGVRSEAVRIAKLARQRSKGNMYIRTKDLY